MGAQDETLVGVDIGTTEVRAVVAARTATGSIGYRAAQQVGHEGVRAGRPVHLEATTRAVSAAVRGVLQRAGVEADGWVLGVSGETFRIQPRRGSWRLGPRGGTVRRGDVRGLYHRTLSRYPPQGYRRTGSIERSLSLDGERVAEPAGRSGTLLEMTLLELLIDDAAHEVCQHLDASLPCPLACVLVHPITSGVLLLSPEEKARGVVLIDFGAAHTHLAFFTESSPLDAVALSFGSMHLSAELARRLRLRFPQADSLKTLYGGLSGEADECEALIALGDGLSLERAVLAHGIEQILAERWLTQVQQALQWRGGVEAFPGGVVFTGRGSQLPGFAAWVGGCLRLPVRMARVTGPRFPMECQSPVLHTSLGLVHYALEQRATLPAQPLSWLERLQGWWRSRRHGG